MEIIGLFTVTNFGLVMFADNALKVMADPLSSETLSNVGCALIGGLIAAAGATLEI